MCYATYTGKAADVLRKKGNPNACTLHKLLFNFSPKETGGFYRIPKKELEYDLIIVDEISMVPKEMVDLLFSHNCHVICLGDPFQLPQIYKNDDNHLLDSPHIFLDEIVRQASESEIITTSMMIRNYKPLKRFSGNEVKIYEQNDFIPGMYTWANQIVVATNKKRKEVNKTIRSMLGLDGEPRVGDKVISLKNNWDILDNSKKIALVNGTIGYIKKIETKYITYRIGASFVLDPVEVYIMTIESEIGEVFSNIMVDKKYFMTGKKSFSDKQEYLICQKGFTVPCLFDFGYAITCHKAQGSSWKNILVLEERFPFEYKEHARWLYTACTRAENKLVLIKKG